MTQALYYDMYIWFVTLYLYTVNITFITYCRIVYLNHIFHCNLCNEEINEPLRTYWKLLQTLLSMERMGMCVFC
jgi:hypothetical protein